MPKVVNYFVRPEGVTLSLATVKDVQYGESIDKPKTGGGWGVPSRLLPLSRS